MAGKKQSEYQTIIRLAGKIDPSWGRTMKSAIRDIKQFMELDASGKAKEIGLMAAGKGIQLAGTAIQAGTRLAARGMQELYKWTRDSIPIAMEYGTQMRQVARYVDEFRDSNNNLTADYQKFYNELLTVRSIYSPKELAEIAAANAKAQVPLEELMSSVKLSLEVGTAFNSTAGVAGDIVRTMYAQQGMSIDEIRLLADSVSRVADNSNADAISLMKIIASKGSMAEIGGLDQRMVAAIGATLGANESGFGSPEKIATSLKNIVSYLNEGDFSSDKRQQALKRLNLTSAETAEMMQKDGGEFLKGLLEKAMHLPEKDRLGVLGAIFGRQSTGDVAQLAQNIDKLDHFMRMAYSDDGETVKSVHDFIVSQDPAHRLTMLQNMVEGFRVRVGTALMPGVENFLDAILGRPGEDSPLGELFSELEQPIAEFGKAFGETIGAVVKDPDVQSAFKELLRVAPELLGSLLPAIPPLAKFAANLAIAIAPLTEAVMTGLVSAIIAIEPLLTLLAKGLGWLIESLPKIGRTVSSFSRVSGFLGGRKENNNSGGTRTSNSGSNASSGGLRFAKGYIVPRPTFMPPSLQGEGGEPEALMPLSRLEELLNRRGNVRGGGGDKFVYAPTYNVGPGTDVEELRKTDEENQRDFERRMERWERERGRRNFTRPQPA